MGRKIEADKALIVAASIVAVILLLTYAAMLPREYTDANYGSDAGDLLTAILTGGVAHPSGYPTYLLLGSVFQRLPLTSTFYKGALLSAFFSALAAGLLTFIAGKTMMDRGKTLDSVIPVSVISGIALGISPLFWSQAVIVEVYGLASFFVLCAVLWMLFISNGGIDKKHELGISLLSILIGLGFGDHLMIGLLIPAIAYASYLYLKNKNDPRKLVRYYLLILVATIVVYIALPVRAAKFPPVNWGNPQTPGNFLWLVSGKLYQGLAFSIPVNEIVPRFLYFLSTLRTQFGIIGAFLGIMGIVSLLSSQDRMKPIYFWMLVAFLLFSLGYKTDDSIVYLIPFIMVFTLLITYGLYELFDLLKAKEWLPRILLCLVFLVPLIVRVPLIFEDVDPRDEQDARDYARTCLDELPPNALLVTREDKDTLPIWYFHYGLKERQDIHVIVEGLIVYDWYRETLVHIYPDLELNNGMVTVMDISNGNPDYRLCQPVLSAVKGFVFCECTLE